jgi:hypothetical protein
MTVQLADFEGLWRLDRRMVHGDGTAARFEGEAAFWPVVDGLAYEEVGRLILPGQPEMEARRRYLWQPDLTVWFDDGRFFHQIPAKGGETAHWCDPDQYDGVYLFDDWPVWRVTWDVRGPRKDYWMESEYRR